jgi:dihydrofolate synthase/folylpolyglutamate synthase
MNYRQTLDWLYAQLPMYQRVGGANYKINLEKTQALMELLDHPESGFKSIHVAGTNGKGSVSHMIASVLQQKGLKVGLYTSPHLIDFRERIRINGKMINKQEVIDFVARFKNDFERLQLSFFEMTVGLAFHHFTRQHVDIAVIEVGMGGRLDSTNVITPLVSVITNIGLDHQQFLGDTLAEIAHEKAGIIKNRVPVVIGRRQLETEAVFAAKADKHHTSLHYTDAYKNYRLPCDLTGIYQSENIRTAITTLNLLPKSLAPNLSELKLGMAQVIKNTGLRGRWEILGHAPLTICDTGHNEDGVKAIVQQLAAIKKNKLHMVWGMVNDKQIDKILALLPADAQHYFCQPSIPRALPVEQLQAAAAPTGLQGKSFLTVKAALAAARQIAEKEDVIFIGGSTFVVADVLANDT